MPPFSSAPIARRLLALLVTLTMASSGCAGAAPQPLALPAPVEVTTLGVGDVFELHIVGEEKLPVTFTVAPDGSVDLPYIKRLKVSGMEPQEVSRAIRQQLVAGGILVDPSVSVSMKEYNSKRVEIIGEVAKPGSIPLVPGMTLLKAISIAGGFTAMARKGEVTVRRKFKDGTRAAAVSVESIIDNRIPDPLLQSGDSIYVPQRAF